MMMGRGKVKRKGKEDFGKDSEFSEDFTGKPWEKLEFGICLEIPEFRILNISCSLDEIVLEPEKEREEEIWNLEFWRY